MTVREQKEDRRLPCKLSEAELLQRGDRLARIEGEIDDKKAERTDLGGEIRRLNRERAELSQVVESRSEKREVTCRWQLLFGEGKAVLVRDDTRDVVDERPLTDADRQTSLRVDDDSGDDEPQPRTTKPDSPRGKTTRHAH